jgi:hypothetical protein
MGLILVKNNQEEDLMLALLKEFGSKLILPRNANTNEFFMNWPYPITTADSSHI